MNKYIEAVAVLKNKKINGTIIFKEKKEHTKIDINIKGVKPNSIHGFHIHKAGDLREGCTSCCDHYNPFNKLHGGPNDKERHVGDLGNLVANKSGNIKMSFTDKLIKLRGKYNIIGRSVVLHKDEDDLGKGANKESLITGNAGKRIACGIIGYSKNNY